MNNTRLTHEEIKRHCKPDPSRGKDYVICPACDPIGHLHLFSKDSFSCMAAKPCPVDAVAAKLRELIGNGTPKEKKPKPSELSDWQGFTLDDYCAAKGLNRRLIETFFEARTVTRRDKSVVAWTYCDPETGKTTATKLRLSSSSHDTYFEPADPHVPYGTNNPLFRDLIRGTYDLFIAEGETDTHVLASWGFAAIGISGSQGWLPEFADLPIVENAKRVFAVEQQDEAGKTFSAKILKALPKAFILKPPDGVKDFGELHLKYLNYDENEVELFGHPFFNFLNIGIQAAVMERATRQPKQARPQPLPMREAAFYGLAGKVVSLLEPRLETDRASILTNFLGCAGVLFQHSAHFKVVADTHYPVDFYLTVGKTATARKGTTTNAIVEIFERVQEGFKKRIMTGLSTGQGLIQALIKPTPEGEEDANIIPEPIAESVVVEISEFQELLAVMRREENTLSAVMRDAWDGRPLAVLTRKQPLKVDNVSLATIAHITRRELLDKLTATERANGFANRFMFFWTERSKLLPRGDISGVNYNEVVAELRAALQAAQDRAAKGQRAIKRDDDANQLWDASYAGLTLRDDSMIDALLSRAEAHVVRLSLLYALLDGSAEIRKVHLQAALAVWDYCEESVRYIFGDAAEPEYRKILRKLEDGPLTSGEIRRYVFGDNKPSEWVEEKMVELERLRKVRRGTKELKNKTSVAWYSMEYLS
jgi:Protein of unknown function (DUF3987)